MAEGPDPRKHSGFLTGRNHYPRPKKNSAIPMELQSRVLHLSFCIALPVLVLIGGVLPASLHKQNLKSVSGDSVPVSAARSGKGRCP